MIPRHFFQQKNKENNAAIWQMNKCGRKSRAQSRPWSTKLSPAPGLSATVVTAKLRKAWSISRFEPGLHAATIYLTGLNRLNRTTSYAAERLLICETPQAILKTGSLFAQTVRTGFLFIDFSSPTQPGLPPQAETGSNRLPLKY